LTARSVFHGEPHLLQRDPSMVVDAQDVDARPLQCAKKAPLTRRLVVSALTIIRAVPYGWLTEQFIRTSQDSKVIVADGLIAALELWAGFRQVALRNRWRLRMKRLRTDS
jgi:hypothetical protein